MKLKNILLIALMFGGAGIVQNVTAAEVDAADQATLGMTADSDTTGNNNDTQLSDEEYTNKYGEKGDWWITRSVEHKWNRFKNGLSGMLGRGRDVRGPSADSGQSGATSTVNSLTDGGTAVQDTNAANNTAESAFNSTTNDQEKGFGDVGGDPENEYGSDNPIMDSVARLFHKGFGEDPNDSGNETDDDLRDKLKARQAEGSSFTLATDYNRAQNLINEPVENLAANPELKDRSVKAIQDRITRLSKALVDTSLNLNEGDKQELEQLIRSLEAKESEVEKYQDASGNTDESGTVEPWTDGDDMFGTTSFSASSGDGANDRRPLSDLLNDPIIKDKTASGQLKAQRLIESMGMSDIKNEDPDMQVDPRIEGVFEGSPVNKVSSQNLEDMQDRVTGLPGVDWDVDNDGEIIRLPKKESTRDKPVTISKSGPEVKLNRAARLRTTQSPSTSRYSDMDTSITRNPDGTIPMFINK